MCMQVVSLLLLILPILDKTASIFIIAISATVTTTITVVDSNLNILSRYLHNDSVSADFLHTVSQHKCWREQS